MKKIILSLSALMVGISLHAQEDKQNAVVNVENDYNPVVVNVKKKSFTPQKSDNGSSTPLELEFSKGSTPFEGFTSERNVRDLLPKQDGTGNGYVRLGGGTGESVDFKGAYNFKLNETSELRTFASFDGFNTKIDAFFNDEEWKSRMYNTAIDAEYIQKFRDLTFGVTGSFCKKVFNYQSFYDLNDLTNKQNCSSYSIGTNAVSNLSGPFSYSIYAGITHNRRAYSTEGEHGINETTLTYGGNLAHELPGEIFRSIGTDIDADFFIYNKKMHDATSEYSNIFSLDVNPYTNLVYNGWRIKAGIRMNIMSKGAPALAVAPDITIDGMIADGVGLYAEIKGGRVHNGFSAMDDITPYWYYSAAYSRRLEPTYKPIDILVAARISLLEPLSLEGYAGYTYIKDDLQQTIGSVWSLTYVEFAQQDTKNYFLGAKAGYDINGWVNLGAEIRLNHWSADYKDLLIMKPRMTLDINAESRPIKDLLVRIGYNFTHYTAGNNIGRLDNKNDLYARASYQIDKQFCAFIQGDNLFNNSHYEYAGYRARGARCMLGATISF